MIKFISILFSSLTIYFFVLFAGAYLTYKYENEYPSANIKTYQDALWWSLNATSIGNSDVYPITDKGRITGSFLIIIGYCLFTINVATISSLLTNLKINKSFVKFSEDEIKMIKEHIKRNH